MDRRLGLGPDPSPRSRTPRGRRVPRARRRPAGPAHARASPRSARDRPPSPVPRGAVPPVRGDRALARIFGGCGGFSVRFLPSSSQHRLRDRDPIESGPVLLVEQAFPEAKGPIEPPVPLVRRGEPDAHHEAPTLRFLWIEPSHAEPLPVDFNEGAVVRLDEPARILLADVEPGVNRVAREDLGKDALCGVEGDPDRPADPLAPDFALTAGD